MHVYTYTCIYAAVRMGVREEMNKQSRICLQPPFKMSFTHPTPPTPGARHPPLDGSQARRGRRVFHVCPPICVRQDEASGRGGEAVLAGHTVEEPDLLGGHDQQVGGTTERGRGRGVEG